MPPTPPSPGLQVPPSRHTSSNSISNSISPSTSPHKYPQSHSPHKIPQSLPRRPSAGSRKGSHMSVTTLRDQRHATGNVSSGVHGGNGMKAEDGNWEAMDPDEVFRRLTVREVKKVEAKLRMDAQNKQGELRTTVGERYRDLLLSTSQITSLRTSSLRLSSILHDVEGICKNPGSLSQDKGVKREVVIIGKKTMGMGDADDGIVNQLPIAAHMKLLLDAPESLYGMLSTESYLEAAYLWLLTRMVKENLEAMASGRGDDGAGSDDPSNGQAFVPLLQKQWETLAPFRTQIVRRATAALQQMPVKHKRSHPIEALAKTLLAIILLDSNTVQDVLFLFLSQRYKALQLMLEEAPDRSRSTVKFVQGESDSLSDLRIRESRSERFEKGHTRSGSKLNAAAVLRELSPGPGSARAANGVRPESNQGMSTRQDEIKRSKYKARTVRTFVDIAKCLQETLQAVRAIFMAHSESEEGSSLLEEMMKQIQEVTAPVKHAGRTNSTSGDRSTSHKRKTSSLASFSVSLVPPSVSAFRQQAARLEVGGDRSSIVTTQSILEALPSSQILLNFLPASIQGFAPFIPPSPASTGGLAGDMERRLAQWFEKALNFVSTSAKRWLSDLPDIQDIWSVKMSVESALQSSERDDDAVITDAEKEKLHAVLQQAWNVRIRGIWTAKLTQLVDGLESRVEAVLATLASDERRKDIEMRPSRLCFTADLAFPPPPSSTLFSSSSSSSSFESYQLPAFRKALQQRRDARTPLLDMVLAEVETLAASIQQDLSVLPARPDGKDNDLLADYTEAAQDALDRLTAVLEGLGKRVSSNDSSTASAMFLGRLASQLAHCNVDNSICGKHETGEAAKTDSNSLEFRRKLIDFNAKMVSRWRKQVVDQALVIISASQESSGQQLGAAGISLPLQTALGTISTAMLNLGMPRTSELDALESAVTREFAQQALSVYGAFQTSSSAKDTMLLQELASSSATNGHANTGSAHTSDAFKKRNQLLLAPLLRHLPQAAGLKENRQSVLLPFGAPVLSHEYVSPVAVAKPAQRFGMLSTV